MKRSIALLAVFALAGCAITSRDATIDLPGTSWVLVDLDGAAPVGETPPTIAFDDQGGVSGTGGLQLVQRRGHDRRLRPDLRSAGHDADGCGEEGVADQEQAFLAAVQEATSYTVDDEGRLVLQDGATLTFEVAAEAQ